jgi:hypothetical protein
MVALVRSCFLDRYCSVSNCSVSKSTKIRHLILYLCTTRAQERKGEKYTYLRFFGWFFQKRDRFIRLLPIRGNVPLSSAADATNMFEETGVESHLTSWCEYEANGFFIVEWLVFRRRIFACSTLKKDKYRICFPFVAGRQ